MQIVPYSVNTQQVRFSNTLRIGNVALPNFSSFHFNTKITPTMSQDKFKEAITEQAKNDQKAGVLGAHSAGYRSLAKNYLSAVSPDRKKSFQKVYKELLRITNQNQKPLT